MKIIAVLAAVTIVSCGAAAAADPPATPSATPVKHPSLKALPVELPNARRTTRIISLKNRSLSPLAELFIDSMRALAKPLAKRK